MIENKAVNLLSVCCSNSQLERNFKREKKIYYKFNLMKVKRRLQVNTSENSSLKYKYSVQSI